MKFVIAGASGLIGSALVEALEGAGHGVRLLVRRESLDLDEIRWDPEKGELKAEELEGADVVICMSGESVAGGRWSAQRKKRILESRVRTVELLSKRIAECENGPGVFVCASAVGYYGMETGDAEVDEGGALGDGFLAGVCDAWEGASRGLAESGVRVVHVRLGLVLSAKGGALGTMLLPFRLGLGGRLGDGQQWMSWVNCRDVVRVIQFVAKEESISGPVNVTSPNPVRNDVFTRALGRALHRPTVIPLPGFLVRTALGEMGESLLLRGVRAVPRKLLDAGFEFEDPTIDEALGELL